MYICHYESDGDCCIKEAGGEAKCGVVSCSVCVESWEESKWIRERLDVKYCTFYVYVSVCFHAHALFCLFTPRNGASGGGLRPSFQRRHSPRPQPGIWGGKCGVDMLVNSKRFLILVIKDQVPPTCSENRTRLWAPRQKHSYSFSSAQPLSLKQTHWSFYCLHNMFYYDILNICHNKHTRNGFFQSADFCRCCSPEELLKLSTITTPRSLSSYICPFKRCTPL